MDLFGIVYIPNWLLLIVLLLLVWYIYLTWHFNVWASQGIQGPKPYPLFGNILGLFTKGFMEYERHHYLKYGKKFGVIEGRNPVLICGDEDMLREILVKQFSSFSNRRVMNKPSDITKYMLTVLQDDEWKRVRNLLTPTFSTGKLKQMSNCIADCAKQMSGHIADLEGEEMEMKEYAGAFTMDVIAQTAFGFKLDSQKDRDNPFVKMARKVFDFNVFNPFFIIIFFFPFLIPIMDKFKFSFFPKDVMDFFTSVVDQIMSGRNDGEKKQKDLLQLMMNAQVDDGEDVEELKKEIAEHGGTFDDKEHAKNKKGLKKEEIIAQGIMFFIVGYETTATALSLLIYNLATNPECQQKLYEEIQENLSAEGLIDYNDLSKMTYLDMCLSESLRIYPPAVRFDRMSSHDITIKDVFIPKDATIAVPVIGIHYDPEIYPEPDKFKPERFTEEEKAKRSPFHYMPFGYGPRSCIAMRLALLEAKMAVASLVRDLEFRTCERTQIPLTFKKGGLLQPEKGLWLKASKRN